VPADAAMMEGESPIVPTGMPGGHDSGGVKGRHDSGERERKRERRGREGGRERGREGGCVREQKIVTEI
jgi:hypothetical protein